MRHSRAGALLLALFPLQSLATTFLERPFPTTVQEAPVIVRGKVGTSYTNWAELPDGSKRIHTFTELQLDDILKGTITGRTLIMRELGGEKDGVGMQVSGTAQFDRGEDVVVFLGLKNPDGSHDVHGMMMGKYNVERDEQGKEYLVGAGLSSLTQPGLRGHEHLVEPDGEEGQRDTRPDSKWTIEALRQLIRDQAQGATPQAKHSHPPGTPRNPPSPQPAAPAPQTEQPAAPRLQPSAPETTGFPWGILGGAGGLLAALAAIYFATRRK
jgi:hypothetical protein